MRTSGAVPMPARAWRPLLRKGDELSLNPQSPTVPVDEYAQLFCKIIAGKEIIVSHNHGYYARGRRASEAFFRAYYLRQACAVQVKAAAAAAGGGDRLKPIDPQRVAMIQDQMAASENYHYDGTPEWAALLRKLERTCPDYAK